MTKQACGSRSARRVWWSGWSHIFWTKSLGNENCQNLTIWKTVWAASVTCNSSRKCSENSTKCQSILPQNNAMRSWDLLQPESLPFQIRSKNLPATSSFKFKWLKAQMATKANCRYRTLMRSPLSLSSASARSRYLRQGAARLQQDGLFGRKTFKSNSP